MCSVYVRYEACYKVSAVLILTLCTNYNTFSFDNLVPVESTSILRLFTVLFVVWRKGTTNIRYEIKLLYGFNIYWRLTCPANKTLDWYFY